MYLFRGWQAARYSAGRRSVGAIRAPGKILPAGIHCLRGTPRRWGLFGENDQDRSTIFHSVLSTWSTPHTGSLHCSGSRSTNRYRYLSRPPRVRQGRYLSLHDEVKNFPLQHGCAVRLSLRARYWCCLCCYLDPAGYAAEIHPLVDERRADIEATSVKQLADAGVRVGDTFVLAVRECVIFALPVPGARKQLTFFTV